MSNFDWQQEGEQWDEPLIPAPPTPEKRKRPFVPLLVLGALLLLAGWVLFRQADEQIDAVTITMQTDVLAAHNLVQTADETADVELLHSLLSGRLPSWTVAQEAAVEAGTLYGRDAWGLETLPAEPAQLPDLEAMMTLSLTADLKAAELQFPRRYHTLTPAGIQETVTLTQTAVYRRGERSWLLAPPLSDFWGEWVINKGERLTLIYPQRDAAIAERLAVDLEEVVAQICEQPGFPPCTDSLKIALRLDTSPASLAQGVDRRSLFDKQAYLNLPAPTLFGLPQNEAGYEALLRAYLRSVATAVYAELFTWECCDQATIFQALVDYQLSLMGRQAWPITAADHIRAFREGKRFDELNILWRSPQFAPPAETRVLYTFIDFLFNQYPQLSVSSLLNGIEGHLNLAMWLGTSLNQAGYPFSIETSGRNEEALDRAWWRYGYTQTLLAQANEAAPLPLPEQDLALLCMSDFEFGPNTTMSLHRFDNQTEEWSELLTYRNAMVLFNPFLEDDGMVVQSLNLAAANQWLTEIWDFDSGKTVLVTDEETFFSMGQFDPSGRYIVTYAGSNGQSPQPLLIDLDSCGDSTCEMLPLPGIPYWSPDGERTIIAPMEAFEYTLLSRHDRVILVDAAQSPAVRPFLLGDALGQTLPDAEEEAALGLGYSPFWVDNDTFGFIEYQAETGEPQVVIKQIEAESAETVVTLADVEALIPEKVRAPYEIRYVLTHPAQPDLLFPVALDAFGQQVYLFVYDLLSGELTLRLHSRILPFHSLGFSPNGRYLVLIGNDDDMMGRANTLYIHDIAANDTQTYLTTSNTFGYSPLYDWSLDGNWLSFLLDDRVVSLVAPDYQYQMIFAHEQGHCISTAWINK